MPTRERTAPCPDVGLHAVINAPELWRLPRLECLGVQALVQEVEGRFVLDDFRHLVDQLGSLE